jgi:uncharacterized tellurite resistance protein B-like protein|tara:strand:+ start:117 stop:485 length:369 start_codon:yes stop_codon:yes gene_type:complete
VNDFLKSSNEDHMMYKLCILMMLSDRFPHPKELVKLCNIIDSKDWMESIKNEDILDSIDQVSREIYEYKGVRATARIYAHLLKGKDAQKTTLAYCEEIMNADGEIKIEELRVLDELTAIWNS